MLIGGSSVPNQATSPNIAAAAAASSNRLVRNAVTAVVALLPDNTAPKSGVKRHRFFAANRSMIPTNTSLMTNNCPYVVSNSVRKRLASL